MTRQLCTVALDASGYATAANVNGEDFLISDRPAVGPDVLPGDPAGVVRAEHGHHVRDVLRLPEAAQRGHLAQASLLLLGLALAEELGVGRPRRHHVHGDLPGAE